MKRQRKKHERPRRPWDKERILIEKELLKNFGLRRKREIWTAEALLRKYRRMARGLAAKKDKKKEEVLIKKLVRIGLLEKGADLDDVLSLTVEDILERRLLAEVRGSQNSRDPELWPACTESDYVATYSTDIGIVRVQNAPEFQVRYGFASQEVIAFWAFSDIQDVFPFVLCCSSHLG